MKSITVPSYDQVSPPNQALFDNLKKGLGLVPNLYATFARSDTALATYLALQNAKSSLSPKARKVINLVVSQINSCQYCLAAHTALGKMVGFTPEQIIEIRRGGASFDARLDALAKLVRSIVTERGQADPALTQAFFDAGWTKGNLVDAIVVIGDQMTSNFLHGSTQIPVDFHAAPALS